MLNFRTSSVGYIILFLTLQQACRQIDVSPWFLVALTILYVILLIWGAAEVCSNFYVKTYCKGNSSEKKIALSFDDGPDGTITPEVLETLKKHHINAGFFVTGEKAEKHIELLQRMKAEGHIIGNHSYSHSRWFDLFSAKKMAAELQKTGDIIFMATSQKTLLFRPPYGVTNPTLARVVRQLGLQTIGWSIRSLDTSIKDENKLYNRVVSKIRPGAMILFHDNQNRLLSVLEKIIVYCESAGYTFERPDKLLDINAWKS